MISQTAKSKQKVILICGLPGSGKSFLGRKLSKERDITFLDDFVSFMFFELDYILCHNKGCIIADPNFIFDPIRTKVEAYLNKYNVDIEWIFFENDPEQCIKNVIHRNDGRKVTGFIKSFSKNYMPPETAIKVFERT